MRWPSSPETRAGFQRLRQCRQCAFSEAFSRASRWRTIRRYRARLGRLPRQVPGCVAAAMILTDKACQKRCTRALALGVALGVLKFETPVKRVVVGPEIALRAVGVGATATRRRVAWRRQRRGGGTFNLKRALRRTEFSSPSAFNLHH